MSLNCTDHSAQFFFLRWELLALILTSALCWSASAEEATAQPVCASAHDCMDLIPQYMRKGNGISKKEIALAQEIQTFEAENDWEKGRLFIERSADSKGAEAQIRNSTKTGVDGSYLMPEFIQKLIAKHCSHARFDPSLPLFRNPHRLAKSDVWTDDALANTWRAALDSNELPWVPLYKSMKHTQISALRDAGLPVDDILEQCRWTKPRDDGALRQRVRPPPGQGGFGARRTGGQGEALNPTFGARLVLGKKQANFLHDIQWLQARPEVRVLFAAPIPTRSRADC